MYANLSACCNIQSESVLFDVILFRASTPCHRFMKLTFFPIKEQLKCHLAGKRVGRPPFSPFNVKMWPTKGAICSQFSTENRKNAFKRKRTFVDGNGFQDPCLVFSPSSQDDAEQKSRGRQKKERKLNGIDPEASHISRITQSDFAPFEDSCLLCTFLAGMSLYVKPQSVTHNAHNWHSPVSNKSPEM